MEKIKKLEAKILDFVTAHDLAFLLVILTIIAIMIRISLFNFESTDFTLFLSPWFQELKSGGGLKALAHYPGDYNAPYMTIMALLTYLSINPLYSIKIISILFDFFCALASAYLVYTLTKQNKNQKWLTTITYLAVLYLPQIILNSSFWGQCDVIYVTFSILAFTFLLQKKYTLSFLTLGISFAFKFQFIFILPIFFILYVLERKYSVLHFLLLPLVNFVLCLPAIIAGKPIIECLLTYFNQTKAQSYALTRNFINIYQIFQADASYFHLVGTLFTLAICVFVLFYLIHKKIKLNQEKIMTITLWFLIIIPFFLPQMHERYLLLGEIFAVLYYICYRKNGFLVILINLNALITYTSYFYGNITLDYSLMACINLFAIGYFSKNVFQLLNTKE